MKPIALTSNQIVAQVIGDYPETIHTWIVFKTDCVGCYQMKFFARIRCPKLQHGLEDVSRGVREGDQSYWPRNLTLAT